MAQQGSKEASVPSRKVKPISKRFVIKGEAIVGGFAVGQAVTYEDVLTRELAVWRLGEHQTEGELERLRKAMRKAQTDLSRLKSKVTSQIDAKHAEIFDVHHLILEDVELFKEIEEELRTRLLNAEQIVQNVFRRREKRLRKANDATISERSADVADVGRRLLKVLIGVKESNLSDLPPDSVIFAQRLLPSDTASLNTEHVKAIVTVEGSQNSHSAILARALDIPYVSKISIPLSAVPSKAQVIVDGEVGKIIANPRSKELAVYPDRIQKRAQKKLAIVHRLQNKTLVSAGKRIRVSANVSSMNEVKMSVAFGADGIGLYRTEPLYMGKPNLPAEDDLYTHLREVLKPVQNQAVTLRLLDIGGDKTLPFIDIVEIKDAALGLNGIRLLLKYPALLKMQLRVFLRLSAEFDVRVLVPMISLPKDMQEVRRHLSEEKMKLKKEKKQFNEALPVGAMIETPAAVFAIDEILKLSDFLSLGTNDLVQYVMAAGREKPDVAEYYEAGNSLILDVLKTVNTKAEAQDKECTLCGELAGNLKFTEILLNLGLKSFSVQPALIPIMKNKIDRILNKNVSPESGIE